MLLYVKLEAPVLSHSEISAANTPSARWTDYPGERLLKKVSFEVNGNPLDQYNSDATVFHRKFLVQPNKILSWKRLVGQQVPMEAEVNADETGLPEGHRVLSSVVNGAQTPKGPAAQQGLTLMIPLLFWCN